jgi:hypothetical protein
VPQKSESCTQINPVASKIHDMSALARSSNHIGERSYLDFGKYHRRSSTAGWNECSKFAGEQGGCDILQKCSLLRV